MSRVSNEEKRRSRILSLISLPRRHMFTQNFANVRIVKLRSQFAIKRLLDISLASFGLLLSAPFFLLLAILVRLESPGASFFRQLRSGRLGRPFVMFKFRTMYEGVPHVRNADGSAFVGRGDPRITQLGRFLREFSIDELPQLFNVLRGDMSLIGPRPETIEYTAELPDWARLKLQVRPGCLSLGLIHGRNELSWKERNEMDVWYVQNYSLWLDVRLLLLGIWAMVVTRRGVYSPERLQNAQPVAGLVNADREAEVKYS